MQKILLSISCLLPLLLFAQQYNVLLIPDSLKKDANLVVRTHEIVVEIKSPAKATVKEKYAYTILNEAGASHADYVSSYDRFHSINYISAALYDAMGKEIKHVKKKDMEDVSGGDEVSLITDNRYKQFDFYCRTYPYTVEYEEEDDYNGLLGFPSWTALPGANSSAVLSRYVIIASKDYVVRYRPNRLAPAPVITEEGNKKIYTWQIKNLPAISPESNSPLFSEMVPNIIFAPSEFEVEGYKGNMSTWEGFGKFLYELTKGRDALPDDVKATVHQLTDHLKDDKQKVYALYDLLQKNTRYISVQLGIGGWQPFDAKYVATKRYGDCKALSNYMVALLKEAGITARYVIITAGRNARPLMDDFSCLQGNHAVTCVPLAKDSIWLECTSQTELPGFSGSFTGDRKAILIDENGGHIVSTPRYEAKDNQQLRITTAVINAEGDLDAAVTTKFTGTQQELPRAMIYEVSKDWREKYLNQAINLPTYQVEKSSYEELKGETPAVKEYLHVLSTGYGSVTGKRLFIAPNLFNKTGLRYSADSVRKYDIIFNSAFIDIDSVIITVPPGYVPEALPAPVDINSQFATYHCAVKVEGNKILYTRMEERHRNRFPASQYAELVKVQEQIFKADRAKLVLVKKE
ncbi:MAG TPA: DUF3857 and transglutaminase domain-containing protein [Chitinophagaceae bacterium]|nr:DUF3857 and transglutaminase domain-containing protein [Chitinophagaceae bacterium]